MSDLFCHISLGLIFAFEANLPIFLAALVLALCVEYEVSQVSQETAKLWRVHLAEAQPLS